MHVGLREWDVPEAYPDWARHRPVMVPAEQQAAGRRGVSDPPRQHQAARPLGEQPVATGIRQIHQRRCPLQQVSGHIR